MRTIISLLEDYSVHRYLSKEPLPLIVSVCVQQGVDASFEFAVHAAASASRFDLFKRQLIEKGYIESLICSAVAFKIRQSDLVEAVARSLCYISTLSSSDLDWLVTDGNIMVILHMLHSFGSVTARGATMIACILKNLSTSIQICASIVSQSGFKLLGKLLMKFSVESPLLCRYAVYFMQNIARDSSLHETMIEQKMLFMLKQIVFSPTSAVTSEDSGDTEENSDDVFSENDSSARQPNLWLTAVDVFNVVRVIDLVAVSASCRAPIVREGVVVVFQGLSNYIDESCRHAMAW
jgi:hypothetical protein